MKTVVQIASILKFAGIFWGISLIVPLDKGGDAARGILWVIEGVVMALWMQYVEKSKWTKLTIE
jgi:hypothetical protein